MKQRENAEKNMQEEIDAYGCEQADDLIAFLYGELDKVQAEIFQRHAQSCLSCKQELAAFQGVRQSVIAWRDEALVGSFAAAPSSVAAHNVSEKPSALAAIREFFRLSPVWMKGALALATVLFCLLAGLAIMRMRNTPPPTVAGTPQNKAYSDQELKVLVDRRVQDELSRIKNLAPPLPTPEIVTVKQSTKSPNRQAVTRTEIARNAPARRPLSKTEREQLAADLRLVSLNSESELELLDDGINQ